MPPRRSRRRSRRRSEGGAPPLEVRSLDDNGWYDGEISLASIGSSRARSAESRRVRVHFTGFEATDDEFWGAEILQSEIEIRKRVRLRSHQLQDEECTTVFRNMVVCANYLSEDNTECKYYDAIVVDVERARHERVNRQEVCTCNFKVMWREGPMEGAIENLRCEHISRLAQEDVRVHPLVRRILDEAAVTSVAAERVTGEETIRGSQVSHSSVLDPDRRTTPENVEVLEVREQVAQAHEVAQVVTGKGDLRGVDEPAKPAMPAGQHLNGLCESPIGRVPQEDCEMLDVQDQSGVREDDLQDEMKDTEVVDGQKNSDEANGYLVLSDDFDYRGVLGANEQSSRNSTEDVDTRDTQAEKALREEGGGASGSSNFNLAEDIEIPDVHTQKDSLEETSGDNGLPNRNFSEDIDMQGMPAQSFCHRGPQIHAVTEHEISDLEKVADLPGEPDHIPYATELEWEEEMHIVKLRNELDPECKDYEDEYFDLPQDVAEHLRGLQAIQTCLAEGSLMLDKAFREAYLTNMPGP